MHTFTFISTWELPDDVNVIVREISNFVGVPVDFDFYRDGKIISYVDWEKNGIRKVETQEYEDLK